MVQTRITYEGGLRCRAVHAPSDSTLVTDAPTDNHGKGESFSPTDLLGVSLGSCLLTILGMVAERRGWDVAGASVTVEKIMQSEPVRKIARLAVEVRVPGAFDEGARATLERAAATCPVAATLGGALEIDTRWRWGA
ncbi:MAG: osmotically inducible protein OsmC [Planctomycetes bacterium]|jgi:putative redox protein|nr:osmotically inducible protein OsmC [Planctomycetota bacterium]MDP6409820.1 OsmC family protein [Planctomycetota bacterium]